MENKKHQEDTSGKDPKLILPKQEYIDTVGKCANCGVEFHIHKEVPIQEESGWDNIFEDHQKEEYPPFGGPFTDSLELREWLKKNYSVPKRLKQ